VALFGPLTLRPRPSGIRVNLGGRAGRCDRCVRRTGARGRPASRELPERRHPWSVSTVEAGVRRLEPQRALESAVGGPGSESAPLPAPRDTPSAARGRLRRRGRGDRARGRLPLRAAALEALSQWLHQYVGFAATKRALTQALPEAAPDSDVLLSCRTAILSAGTALLERAQQAGVVCPDANFTDVGRMVSGIAVVPTSDPEQQERMLQLALDGLRYRPQDA
jgi:transcriptional regulator SbtR-like protein